MHSSATGDVLGYVLQPLHARTILIIKTAARAAAAAIFVVSAVYGTWRAVGAAVADPAWAERESRALFLEEARRLVPQGARVLALTDVIPAPDFDYWFPSEQPCKLLVKINRAKWNTNNPDLLPFNPDKLEENLKRDDLLLDQESLGRWSAQADFVVIADLDGAESILQNVELLLSRERRALLRLRAK